MERKTFTKFEILLLVLLCAYHNKCPRPLIMNSPAGHFLRYSHCPWILPRIFFQEHRLDFSPCLLWSLGGSVPRREEPTAGCVPYTLPTHLLQEFKAGKIRRKCPAIPTYKISTIHNNDSQNKYYNKSQKNQFPLVLFPQSFKYAEYVKIISCIIKGINQLLNYNVIVISEKFFKSYSHSQNTNLFDIYPI